MTLQKLAYQSQPPFGRLPPRKVYLVDPPNIQPVIRIAHHIAAPIHIEHRIIFEHEIVLFLAGRGRVTTQSQSVDFEAGHLFVLWPIVRHTITVDRDQPCEHLAIHFDVTPNVPQTDDRLDERGPYEVRFLHGLSWPWHLVLPPAHSIENMMRRVIEAHESTELLARLQAITSLSHALIEMFRLHTQRNNHDAQTPAQAACRIKLGRAIHYLQQHLASEITVEDLAGAAGLSASYVTRLFKQWTGTTPMHYLRRARIERARQLLADVDLSIQQVGVQVGFADPYHFSKVFRRIDGLSPSAFRRMLLAGRDT